MPSTEGEQIIHQNLCFVQENKTYPHVKMITDMQKQCSTLNFILVILENIVLA